MERLCGIAFCVPIDGRPYRHLRAVVYYGHRIMSRVRLEPCDVLCGQRTRALRAMRKQYVRVGGALRPFAPPLPDLRRYTSYGWCAPPLPGGFCGGLPLPAGFGRPPAR